MEATKNNESGLLDELLSASHMRGYNRQNRRENN